MTDSKNCTCLADTAEECKKAVANDLSDTQYTDLRVEYSGAILAVYGDGNEYGPVAMPMNISYRGSKKCGTPHKTLTQKKISILMRHCPLCGQKYV